MTALFIAPRGKNNVKKTDNAAICAVKWIGHTTSPTLVAVWLQPGWCRFLSFFLSLFLFLFCPCCTNKQQRFARKYLWENIEAFEMQCYRRSMRISYTEHVTNDEVLRRVGQDRKKEERQMGMGYEFLNDYMSYLQMCKLIGLETRVQCQCRGPKRNS